MTKIYDLPMTPGVAEYTVPEFKKLLGAGWIRYFRNGSGELELSDYASYAVDEYSMRGDTFILKVPPGQQDMILRLALDVE